MAEASPACTTSAGGAPFLRILCARVGTTLTAQWALPPTPPSAHRHLFQSCHPERNFVIGKANDKVESKEPMSLDTTPGNARRSHRAVIAQVPHSCASFAQEWGNHTDRTMGLASQLPSACCDIGTLFDPVILSGTLLLAKPMTKWSRRTPCLSTPPPATQGVLTAP